MLRFPGDEEESQPVEAHEDARLLGLIGEGDQGALEALYRRRGSLIYSVLVRMLVNDLEAQEVLQDTFLRIWRRAGTFDATRSNATSWMVMIARGHALDRLRSRSRRTTNHAAYEREVAGLQLEVSSDERVGRDDLARACQAALNGLPEKQGHALQMAFFRGWTHEEIARATGEPLGTIKARIRRGLVSLRKTFKEYYG